MFIQLLFSDPRLFAAMALVVVFSICAHEFMHAYVALKYGDPTAADAGHLTMSPFKQMGLWSLITLCLVGIAWGQVPVNRANLPRKSSRILVSLAGVAANLGLAIVFTLLAFAILMFDRSNNFAFGVLFFGATINLVLLVINLFPVPGFDGWNILMEYWHPKQSSEAVNGTFFIMIMLLFFGIGYVETAAAWLVKSAILIMAGAM